MEMTEGAANLEPHGAVIEWAVNSWRASIATVEINTGADDRRAFE